MNTTFTISDDGDYWLYLEEMPDYYHNVPCQMAARVHSGGQSFTMSASVTAATTGVVPAVEKHHLTAGVWTVAGIADGCGFSLQVSPMEIDGFAV